MRIPPTNVIDRTECTGPAVPPADCVIFNQALDWPRVSQIGQHSDGCLKDSQATSRGEEKQNNGNYNDEHNERTAKD
jgi:hypothetical protein